MQADAWLLDAQENCVSGGGIKKLGEMISRLTLKRGNGNATRLQPRFAGKSLFQFCDKPFILIDIRHNIFIPIC